MKGKRGKRGQYTYGVKRKKEARKAKERSDEVLYLIKANADMPVRLVRALSIAHSESFPSDDSE